VGRVGLTVSSLMVALGEPAASVGLLDPDSEFALGWGAGPTVTLLGRGPTSTSPRCSPGWRQSPGGPFRSATFEQGEWGPVLPGRSWAG
jgi:hypothetical protein